MSFRFFVNLSLSISIFFNFFSIALSTFTLVVVFVWDNCLIFITFEVILPQNETMLQCFDMFVEQIKEILAYSLDWPA